MKLSLAFFVIGLCALAYAASTGEQHTYKFDKVKLQYQKDVLTLFKHVHQPSYYKEHVDIVKNFHIEEHVNDFTKPEVYKHFYEYYKYHSFLPRGEIFSVFHKDHVDQAIAVFKLFYYAKDFETFYKTAVWARHHLNEGLFLYSFSVAVVHRPDTYYIVLPPIYEIYPHYFYNSEVINKAYYYKQVHHGEEGGVHHNQYVVHSNYSGHYLNLHPEQSLSYYLEDVGINSFYYYYNIYYPTWMKNHEYHFEHEHRGEFYYFFHQQLLARYYLERLSNGFGQIEWFNWDVPFETSYYPSLQYHNGLAFPVRPQFVDLHEYFYNYGQNWCWKGKYGYSFTFVKEYEHRILEAIDKGYVYTHDGQKVELFTKEGFNTLGNLVEGNVDSPDYHFYGPLHVYARHLLGYSYQPLDNDHLVPSALEHYETTLRDPAFYQFYKKVLFYFQKYKYQLKPYTEKDLFFPGVKVHKVEFDRLITFFETFDADITNAVYVTPEEYEHDSFHVYARQHRLNHKPFTYNIYVNSDKATKAHVKVFIGPKYDEYGRHINIKENRLNFVHFDHFVYDLQAGENVINRHSTDSHLYGPDRTSYYDLYKVVLGAYEGSHEFSWEHKKSHFFFPQRYMLPKGTENGMTYQFYVFVYPYVEHEHTTQHVVDAQHFYPGYVTGEHYYDGYDYGYPFDRFIKHEELFYHVPNSYFYETKIYHKHVDDIVVHH